MTCLRGLQDEDLGIWHAEAGIAAACPVPVGKNYNDYIVICGTIMSC